jgi:NAD(P)-dependent dehydrogenase (short-subunit alcohol dehydrogenase family)
VQDLALELQGSGLRVADVLKHRPALYAKELRDTAIKVNAANPGYTATNLNGNSGFRSAAEGAEVSVHLATLDASGPTGTLRGYLWSPRGAYGTLPW